MLKKNSQSSFKSDPIEYEVDDLEKTPQIEIDNVDSFSN